MTKKSSTLADFKNQFDPAVVVENRILAGLASLAKEGAEAWEPEQMFLKRAGINALQVSALRSKFEKHIVLVKDVGSARREKRPVNTSIRTCSLRSSV